MKNLIKKIKEIIEGEPSMDKSHQLVSGDYFDGFVPYKGRVIINGIEHR